jgi:exopolysaccharide biosynthesis polyprenyl glycosylphosphotransferase
MERRIGQPMSEVSVAQLTATARGRRRSLAHLVWVLVDVLLIYAAFALAHWLRYDIQLGRDIYDPQSYRNLDAFYPIILAFTAVLIVILHFKGFYRLPRAAPWFDYVGIIISAVTTALALVIMWLFVRRAEVWSRLILVFVWAAVIMALSLSRIMLRQTLRWAWERGRWLDQVLVVGNRGLARQVMAELLYTAQHGTSLVGYIDGPPDDRDLLRPEEHLRWLGTLEDLESILNQREIDQVIVALPFWAHDRLPDVVATCRAHNVEFRVAPDLYELSFDRVNIQQLSSIPLLNLQKYIIKGWNYVFKRSMDIALIGLTLPIWGGIWGLAALLIKFTAPGAPTTFKQPRIGKNGTPFIVYKLRTMVPNAEALKQDLLEHNEAEGALFKIKDDPRVTRLGKFLRKFSIDELPQLLNVLRGDMSLVGPRPQVPDEVAQYQAWHYRRLEVTPGLTGLWQASGRSDTSFDDMVRLDIYYTEHWSLWLDLRILLLTVPAVLFGRGAY